MRFNKKGAISETDKILFWVIFVLPACGLIVSLIFIAMPRLLDAQTKIDPLLQQDIYMSSVINSPNCLAYEDTSIGRVYTGHIDISKATKNRLDDCLRLERRDLGFFLSIYSQGNFIKEIETKNVLSRVGARAVKINKPVTIVDGTEKYNGVLKFTFY